MVAVSLVVRLLVIRVLDVQIFFGLCRRLVFVCVFLASFFFAVQLFFGFGGRFVFFGLRPTEYSAVGGVDDVMHDSC
ncbi:Uncharacterised protein [Mycobacteroides abscessus subsp. bolletii]|nr:Uncharacterised protein [Mycobacteroides abscessus subsp. bolletii]SKF86419.1 Uncharacterised protein [Mycobacteroides abscessus subsp. bolletii]SKH84569.1 Uncharacterised protein [Mycobacteroides abscessus subsp. bolletii]SKJ68988.1 Uncharacterised protein [Mycobacteroides abscessus subsp. bolletii]